MTNSSLRTRESGSAMFASLIATVTLLGFGLTMISTVTTATAEHETARTHLRRLYVAESGIQSALMELSAGGVGNVGTAGAPLEFGEGTFWVTTVDNGNGTFTATSRGTYAGGTRVIEALVGQTGHVFHHAIFAGNSSEDPDYQLVIEGTGGQSDEINGDMYSGGDIKVTGDATLNGTARANGQVIGGVADAYEGVSQPIPDFQGMNYEVNHDVDVAAEFGAATWQSDDAGGSAFQLPESNPAHIFRKNPSDRTVENATTVKDDYYLEDPYESPNADSDWDGTDPFWVSLTQAAGTQELSQVFYIDGNLWIHNYQTFSMKIRNAGTGGTRVTFVVKGNIVISDNLFIENDTLDGVALVAIKDVDVADSGNIYFGDPAFGTLETMEAFMYAENDFYDRNLDASGSSNVVVNGTMAAGNKVDIDRNVGGNHSRLEVNFDDRIKAGSLSLPGLPRVEEVLAYAVTGWIETSPYQ